MEGCKTMARSRKGFRAELEESRRRVSHLSRLQEGLPDLTPTREVVIISVDASVHRPTKVCCVAWTIKSARGGRRMPPIDEGSLDISGHCPEEAIRDTCLAEILAIKHGLDRAAFLGLFDCFAMVQTDSRMAKAAVTDETLRWRRKYIVAIKDIKTVAAYFYGFHVEWVKREANEDNDERAKRTMRQAKGVIREGR
jgi:hypothetical protein